MKLAQMGGEQLLVTKLPATGRTRVFRFHSALVLQVLVERISPAILPTAVFALCLLLLAAFLPQVPMIRGLPRVGFTAHAALVELVVCHTAVTYRRHPP